MIFRIPSKNMIDFDEQLFYRLLVDGQPMTGRRVSMSAGQDGPEVNRTLRAFSFDGQFSIPQA